MSTVSPSMEDPDDEEGKTGKGEGAPNLKPAHLDLLFDPHSTLSEERFVQNKEQMMVFGDWQLNMVSLLLYHEKNKKRLMIEALDSPSKMMKVIVALSMQGNWDTENLVRAMDRAAQIRFTKGLYHLLTLTHDTYKLDWRDGTLKAESARHSLGGSTH